MAKTIKRSKKITNDRGSFARLLEMLRAGRDQRGGMVRRIKNKIRGQSYENPLKLQVCVDRLFDELSGK